MIACISHCSEEVLCLLSSCLHEAQFDENIRSVHVCICLNKYMAENTLVFIVQSPVRTFLNGKAG
jgi:hypothetical protein